MLLREMEPKLTDLLRRAQIVRLVLLLRLEYSLLFLWHLVLVSFFESHSSLTLETSDTYHRLISTIMNTVHTYILIII